MLESCLCNQVVWGPQLVEKGPSACDVVDGRGSQESVPTHFLAMELEWVLLVVHCPELLVELVLVELGVQLPAQMVVQQLLLGLSEVLEALWFLQLVSPQVWSLQVLVLQ